VFLHKRFVNFDNSAGTDARRGGFLLLACGLGTTVKRMFNIVSLVYDGKISREAMFPNSGDVVGAQRAGGAGVTPVIITWAAPWSSRWIYPARGGSVSVRRRTGDRHLDFFQLLVRLWHPKLSAGVSARFRFCCGAVPVRRRRSHRHVLVTTPGDLFAVQKRGRS